MKKVYQTIFGEGKGNCFAACIAAILEMKIENVPNFCVEYPDTWKLELNKWLEQFGLGAILVPNDEDLHIRKGYACAGISVKDVIHSVVYKDLKFVYNPDPKWEDFDAEVVDYLFFVVLDPSIYIQWARPKSHPRREQNG